MKEFKRRIHSVTLLELAVVIVVLGIILALVLPNLTKTREHTFDQEVITNLLMIWHAEEMYRMETGCYYPSSSLRVYFADINKELRLSLNDKTWNYSITGGSGTCASSYNASANRPSVPDDYERYFGVRSGVRQITCDGDGCVWSTYDF